MQLARHGGAEAAESPDGHTLYYAKVPEAGSGLWSIPSEGGEEVRVLEEPRFGYWAMSRNGIYFVAFDALRRARRLVKFLSFESHEVTQVGEIEETVAWTNTPGFAISPDRSRRPWYTSLESVSADLMLVDGFR